MLKKIFKKILSLALVLTFIIGSYSHSAQAANGVSLKVTYDDKTQHRFTFVSGKQLRFNETWHDVEHGVLFISSGYFSYKIKNYFKYFGGMKATFYVYDKSQNVYVKKGSCDIKRNIKGYADELKKKPIYGNDVRIDSPRVDLAEGTKVSTIVTPTKPKFI